MQGSTSAFASSIGGNDMVVETSATVLLPIVRTNLVPNPTFSYGLLGWLPAGTPTCTLTQSSVQAHSGFYSGLITWGAGAALSQVQFTALVTTPGTQYTASVYVFVPAGNPVVVIGATGANLGSALGSSSSTTGAWQRLTLVFTAVDTITNVGVFLDATATAGQVAYMDDWLVEADVAVAGAAFDGDNPSDVNLLANPSFEQPIIAGEDWTIYNCTALQDTTWAFDGNTSVALTPTSSAVTSFLEGGQGIGHGMQSGMLPGFTYTMSATINVPAALSGANGGSQSVRISIVYKVGSTYTEVQSPLQGPLTGGTVRLSVTAAIPSTAVEAFVRLYNGYGNTAANIVRFDAVLLRQATSDTAYFGGRRTSVNNWLGAAGNSASTLNADPYGDVSLALETVSVTRQMVTDMPANTRLISGYPSATATLSLGGLVDQSDETKTAAWLFNQFDQTSPMWGRDPADARVVIQQGLITPAGAELIQTFTGTVDEADCDSTSGKVTLVCADPRGQLRQSVTLPSFAANTPGHYAPGLTAQWVQDYLLRANGINSSPPPRPNCLFYVSCHGSVWPEVTGTFANTSFSISAYMAFDALLDSVTSNVTGGPTAFLAQMRPGYWSEQVVRHPFLQQIPVAGSPTAALFGASGGFYFEGWLNAESASDSSNGGSWVALSGNPTDANYSTAQVWWSWAPGASTASMSLFVIRPSGSTGSPGKAITATFTTDTWHHCSVFVQFTGSTTATVTVTIDNVTTTTLITGLPAAGGEDAPLFSHFVWLGLADSVQMTNETAPVPYRAFYPSAYLDPSLNALFATIDTTGLDPWTVIQQLAEAEMGVAGFDELGVFRFRNRANLTAASAVRSVQSTSSLKSLGVNTQKSTMANHISAQVNSLICGVQQNVWVASDLMAVPAHGSYSTVITTSSPVIIATTPDGGYYSGATPPPNGATQWRASKTAGGGTQVTSGIKVVVSPISPTAMALTISNSNPFTVYMVSPTVYSDVSAGTPYLYIGGTPVLSVTGVLADSQWPPVSAGGAASNPRGAVALSLPSNPWIQDLTTAQLLTDDVLSDLFKPRPIITNLSIVADPRLQLTDRVTIVDPDGSAMNDDVVLSSITITDGDRQWGQTLDARAVASPGTWIMGQAGRSELGVTTRV